MKKSGFQLLIIFVIGALLLWFGLISPQRIDLTQDKRYTLNPVTKDLIQQANTPLIVDVFLKGNFPPEFRKLQAETQQLLEEFKNQNPNINYVFHDPNGSDSEEVLKMMDGFGITPAQVSVMEGGKQSVELVYPWAIAHYQDNSEPIALLKNQIGSTTEERINSSLQNLQYAFADGFKKLLTEKSKKIAVIKGNGQLDDRYIFDFFTTVRDYYFTAAFTLDSVASNPAGTLQKLKEYDLIVIAQPTIPFTEEEKYVLDQYILNGGKSLWLMDALEMHRDPDTGNSFVFGKDLNLNDFFFRYGIRINPNLVKDMYSAPIVLASGEERETQYDQYPWLFSPLSSSASNHPIVTNIEAVKFDYASSMDTLSNDIKKTILLSSSPISRIIGLPFELSFDREIPKNLETIQQGPDPQEYNAGEIPLAVLLEGKFTSAFKNRIKPFSIKDGLEDGKFSQMVVISDGDIIKNQMEGNRPLELGFDKLTHSFYGNKEFLLNTVDYLLDDSGLINIRTRQISIPFMDMRVASLERTKWQALNLLLPLGILGIFAAVFHWFRKKKYAG